MPVKETWEDLIAYKRLVILFSTVLIRGEYNERYFENI